MKFRSILFVIHRLPTARPGTIAVFRSAHLKNGVSEQGQHTNRTIPVSEDVKPAISQAF